MITKPSGCIGCPLYDKGEYFTPDHINPNSKVLFLAQNPGANEEAGQLLKQRHFHGYGQYTDEYLQVQPQPLIGVTGQQFNRRFLPLSGLKRADISLANAIRCRPGSSLGLKADELPKLTSTMKLDTSQADIVKALRHCRDTYLKVPPSTELIVTMGRYAMFSLTGIQSEEREYGKKQGVVESWRGYAVDTDLQIGHPFSSSWYTIDTNRYHDLQNDNIKIFFTMHIAALSKGGAQGEYENQSARGNKQFTHATLQDFHKIKLLLSKQWPLPLPSWHSTPPVTWPKYAAFDTEYYPESNELIRWSLCDTDYRLYCVESDGEYNSTIPIHPGSTVLTQNALADISHLSRIVDVSAVTIEDMMLAHSVLWTGEPHNLNYIASKYGAFNRYKHLSSDQPQLYSALDAYEPMHMWKYHFIPQFKADPASRRIYKRYRLPLINIINKAQITGAKVDTGRLNEVQRILQSRLQEYQEQARLITGNDKLNLGGRKAMMEHIYG